MKKLLIVLFVLLAIFAVASCKQDPQPADTPETTPPDNTPDKPVFTEPKWESGVLRVRPADDATFSQSGKFQFKMDIEYNANEPISFKAKFTEDITVLEVREGGNGDTFFIPKGTSIDNWEQDDDGWYIISIEGSSVTPANDTANSLGITTRLPDDDRSICYVAIKDMKINNVPVDFKEYIDDDSFISSYVTSPNELDVLFVE